MVQLRDSGRGLGSPVLRAPRWLVSGTSGMVVMSDRLLARHFLYLGSSVVVVVVVRATRSKRNCGMRQKTGLFDSSQDQHLRTWFPLI